MTDLTPESLAELRRLLDAWREATEARGFMLMPPMEYVTIAADDDLSDVLPALLDAAERDLGVRAPDTLADLLMRRVRDIEAERDALADEVADMVPRDWHGLMTILADVYPETAFPTLPDHEARDAGPRIVSLLRRVDALAATIERVRALALGMLTDCEDGFADPHEVRHYATGLLYAIRQDVEDDLDEARR